MSERDKTPGGEILVYTAEDGSSRIRVLLEDETVWLTQGMMAELYETTKQNISLHIVNIYEDGELSREATVKEYLTVRQEGNRTVRRMVEHYNLDMIIAVGYRVRSPRGTQFRQWATEHLREYLVKGFTIDDERLKGGGGLTDYFDELLARIREIRASEARVYQRIRDILALASDYVEDDQETQLFFATMQNKMHYAAAGMTAAEIICQRADAAKPNMGLTAWKGGHVLKRDVGTAKNYLTANEIDTLNRITVMFLDQAEFRAQRRRDIRMRDWELFLDKFLRDTELPVLGDAGALTRGEALAWAHAQYDAFAERRRLEAEAEAEKRYLDDLRQSAQVLERQRKSTKKKPHAKARRRKGKKEKH
ncbi:MAG TPA: RhuM family protein [Candidatus Hydrogenedentes bacterium]|nr:RhuM family protein [Candidatus Hydrogenedentota bacterium]